MDGELAFHGSRDPVVNQVSFVVDVVGAEDLLRVAEPVIIRSSWRDPPVSEKLRRMRMRPCKLDSKTVPPDAASGCASQVPMRK